MSFKLFIFFSRLQSFFLNHTVYLSKTFTYILMEKFHCQNVEQLLTST